MGESHADLCETHILGDDTHEIAVRAEACEALARARIAHVGIRDAAAPHRVVRTWLGGAYLHGCLEGEGRTLLDGAWRAHGAGVASLAPAHVLHAFECVPGRRWRCCWVRYAPSSARSREGVAAPVFARFDAAPLSHAILGLHREAGAPGGTPAACALWIDLIEHYVDRLAAPAGGEGRLGAVWAAVRREPGRAWRLDDLAAVAGVSGEQLRRLCNRGLGRSPMRQLAHIRMQAAAHMLAQGGCSVERAALEVGYDNPFAFSQAFRRVTGFRPSRFRDARPGEPRPAAHGEA